MTVFHEKHSNKAKNFLCVDTEFRPRFTKFFKLILKHKHIILAFVSSEIMLKLVFSKVTLHKLNVWIYA